MTDKARELTNELEAGDTGSGAWRGAIDDVMSVLTRMTPHERKQLLNQMRADLAADKAGETVLFELDSAGRPVAVEFGRRNGHGSRRIITNKATESSNDKRDLEKGDQSQKGDDPKGHSPGEKTHANSHDGNKESWHKQFAGGSSIDVNHDGHPIHVRNRNGEDRYIGYNNDGKPDFFMGPSGTWRLTRPGVWTRIDHDGGKPQEFRGTLSVSDDGVITWRDANGRKQIYYRDGRVSN